MKCDHEPVLPKGSYLWPLRQKADKKTCKCRKCGKSVILKNYSKVRWIWFFSFLAVYVLYCIAEYIREYTARSTYYPFGDATPYIIGLGPIILLGIISRIAEHVVLPRLKWEENLLRIEPTDADIRRQTKGQQFLEEYRDNSECH